MSDILTLRLATVEDVDSVMAVAASSASASDWTRTHYCQAVCSQREEVVLRTLLVAELGGHLVGFAAATALVAVVPGEAELENVAVLPAHQRRGVGGKLLQAVVEWATELEAGPLRLEVRSANEAAIRLYQRHGFVQTGLRRSYYAAPVDDAVCMERSLQ